MAKHTKGKHTAAKKSFFRGSRSSASALHDQSSREEQSEKKAAHSKSDDSPQETQATDESVAEVAASAEETAPLDASTDSSALEQSVEDVAATDISADKTVAIAPVAVESAAAADDSVESQGEDAVEAVDTEVSPEEQTKAFQPVFEPIRKERKGTGKKIGITFGVLLGCVLAVYLIGVFVFSTHFLPNTHIADLDISMQSPASVEEMLDETIGGYSFRVKGQGMDLTVTSKEAGMTLDSTAVTDVMMADQDPWTWPIEIFEVRDKTKAMADAMSATGVSEIIENAVAEVNATAIAPVNATVAFDEQKETFNIVPEDIGTTLDPALVLEQVIIEAMDLTPTIVLTEDVLVKPAVYRDDPALAEAQYQANQYIKADVSLAMDDNPVTEVDASVIGPWVQITPELEVVFNEEMLNEWANEIADSCNTVGSTRTYTRPDGKVITVSGGSYGWEVDSDGLVAAITEAVATGTIGTIDIPVLQSGSGFTTLGGQDWGARYIDADLSEQHARFYDANGALIWESDFVSGAAGGDRATPQGVYVLNHKESPSTLIGEMTSKGVPEYKTKVQYWMPFVGNAVGFHDATWQSAFGGERYKQGYGSHGCLNLPLSAAASLYDLILPGDVVVVHS